MLKSVRKKLKSNSGASILMALMFLLVCTILGMIALRASSTNVNHAKANQTAQQNYYATESAEKLLEDDILIARFSCSSWESESIPVTYKQKDDDTIETTTGTAVSDDGRYTATLTGSSVLTCMSTDTVGLPTVKNALEKIYYGEATPPYEYALSVSVSGFPDVEGTLTIDSDCNLTVSLSSENGTGMTVFFPAIPEGPTEAVTTSQTTEVNETAKTETITTVTTVTTSFRLRWGQPTVTKGAN